MSVIEQLKGQEEAEHIWKWHSRYQDLMTVGWPSYHDAANRDDPIFSSGISHVWRVKHPSTDAELTPTAEVFQVWRFSHACRVALQSVSYEGRLSGCPRCMGFPEMGVAQNHPFSIHFPWFLFEINHPAIEIATFMETPMSGLRPDFRLSDLFWGAVPMYIQVEERPCQKLNGRSWMIGQHFFIQTWTRYEDLGFWATVQLQCIL